MVRVSNADLNTQRHMATYARIVGIQTSLLVQQLAYNDVKRLVSISDEEVEINGDDPLAPIIVQGLASLDSNDGKTEIRPLGSIAALFEPGQLQRSLKPRLLIALSLDDGVELVGALVSCLFVRDETLGTELFSQSYCTAHSLPRFGDTWLFIDMVASRAKPSGGLLVVHAILAAQRSKLTGICAVAVSAGGLRLFRSLGFAVHRFRDGNWRHMCYLRLPQELSFEKIMRHLHFNGDDKIVESICWREPLSTRAKYSVVARC